MSWHFSRALVAAYSAANCSGGAPSAPSNSTPTPEAFCWPGKTTAASSPSPCGTTCEPSTDAHGAAVLTWFLEGFPVRESVVQDWATGLMTNALDCGERWRESEVKFDPGSGLWRTHRCLWEEDLSASLVTFPRWGMMQDGGLFQRVTLPPRIGENDCFSWLTPLASQARRGWGVTLNINPEASSRCGERIRTNTLRDISQFGWKLNPYAHEWLMAWPLGWTDCAVSATDKFQQWRRSHGESSHRTESL